MNKHQYIGGVEHPLYNLTGDVNGTWLAMPDSELANLGKNRIDSVFWLCGDYVETISTSSTFLEGVSPPDAHHQKTRLTEEEVSKRCAVRAQKQVRRIINTNYMTLMWTLTMCPANGDEAHLFPEPVCTLTQRHYRSVRCLWTRFIRRMYAEVGRFPWVVVFELHDSEKTNEVKKGTYHIHFATNVFISWEKVGQLWQHGIVRFDDFDAPKPERGGIVRNPGAYMSKYLGKSFGKSNRHLKRYSRSRDTFPPKKISAETYYEKCFPYIDDVIYHKDRTYEFYNEKHDIGGVYGVCQITYKLKKGAHL